MTLRSRLTPAPTRLDAGDTLRFAVANRTDLLQSDVSHGYVHFDQQVPPYFSGNTLHYGPEAHLEVHQVRARAILGHSVI